MAFNNRIVLITLVVIIGCGRAHPSDDGGPIRTQLNALAQELQAGRIGMVEILQISSSSIFRTQVTPELMEKWWDYKSTIRHIDGSPRDKVVAALKSAVTQQGDPRPDIRWGIVFYSAQEQKRIGALYFDGPGRNGFVNDLPASFKDGLLHNLSAVLFDRP